MRFDLNRSLEHKKTRTFTMIVVGTVIFAYLVTYFVVTFSGKSPQARGDANTKDTLVIVHKIAL